MTLDEANIVFERVRATASGMPLIIHQEKMQSYDLETIINKNTGLLPKATLQIGGSMAVTISHEYVPKIIKLFQELAYCARQNLSASTTGSAIRVNWDLLDAHKSSPQLLLMWKEPRGSKVARARGIPSEHIVRSGYGEGEVCIFEMSDAFWVQLLIPANRSATNGPLKKTMSFYPMPPEHL